MTKKLNKRGFTIVELVVVIVVIAILAAVLIPTVTSLIDKANRSADIQAVNQMNKQLAINEITGDKGITDVYEALEAGGMTARDYHPLASDTYFFWVKELNRIVYVDSAYKVLYPNEYEGKDVGSIGSVDKTYLALGGDIKQKEVQIIDGTATVSSAEELYWLSENINTKAKAVKTIQFPAGNFDLKGANIAIVAETNREKLTIKGSDDANNPTTLTGLVSLDSKCVDSGKTYAAGFVAYVNEGASVEISNITIDGATVGGHEIGGVGALVGRIEQNAGTVTIKNCTVKNSVINGKNKVGALIGSIGTGNVTIDNCNVENCIVNCSEGESGMAIGCVYNDVKLTVDREFNTWCTNTTLNLVATEGRDVVDGNEFTCTSTTNPPVTVPTDYQKLVRVVKDGVQEIEKGKKKYRMFADDAYMTIESDNGTKTIMIAGQKREGMVNLAGLNSIKKLNGEDIDINILYFEKGNNN